jgi:hypothetical protein
MSKHKSLSRHYFIALFVALGFLSGCSVNQGNANDNIAVGGTFSPTTADITSVPFTPTVLATSTIPRQTATLNPSPTSAPASPPDTATETPTITPNPTLSAEQEEALLTQMMADNSGCSLPCWWGIMPGQTTSQTARDTFVAQGVGDWTVSNDGSYTTMGLGYARSDSPYRSHDIIVTFELNEDDVISLIRVDGGYRQEDLRSRFMEDWQQYWLPTLLFSYGVPQRVELSEIGNSPYYRLGLSYPSPGMEVYYYIAPTERFDNGGVRVCFDFGQVDFIYLTLFSPRRARSIPELILNQEAYDSWESATGLDVDAFFEMAQDPDETNCVDLSGDE